MTIIIIGAGFAGASCAWWLTRLGVKDIIILEREEMPGIHASGLNAGLAREFEEDEAIAPLASEGINFISRPPKGFVDRPIIECNGSLLLNTPSRPARHARPQGEAGGGEGGGVHKVLAKSKAIQKVPVLKDAKFDRALFTSTDGIVDIHAYLWAFINGAKAGGVKFITNCTVEKFNVIARSPKADEAIHRTQEIASLTLAMTGKMLEMKADVVVNAGGAWVQQIANMAGAEDLQIKPYRRHLFCTPPMSEVDPKWPFVWDIEHEYYFRPESGGLLLGACDEDEVRPGVPSIDPHICEVLAEKLEKYCPSLSGVSIARQWCGLRTFAPDKRPVIKWDNKIKNFFWLAALGGRGVTCAASTGRIAAEKIINRL